MALWREKNLDEMYRMLMQEDLASVELQVRGWKALAELFNEQHERLKAYKTALQQKWTSPGGEAYLGKMDQVMTSLQDAATAFEHNAFKLEAARAAISGAQGTLEALIQQFEDGALTDAWNSFRADEYDKRHSDGPLGIEGLTDLGEDPKPPERKEVLESSGYNTRGKDVMDRLTEEVDQFYQDFKYPEPYQGPKDAVKAQRMGMPGMPGLNGPGGMPGAPGMPGTPGMPGMPGTPELTPQQQEFAKVTPTPNLPPVTPPVTPPVAPPAPGMPMVPPTVTPPGAPMAPGSARPPLRPTTTGRPAVPSAPSAQTTAPTAPGKPGAPGRMAPPPSAMNPKNSKQSNIPGRPNRPGTPIGGQNAPGKPGAPGRMAPPPSAMNPKTSKRGNLPHGTPGDPDGTARPGAGGKPGSGRMTPPPTGAGGKGGKPGGNQGYGGKPGAGQPGKPGRPTTGSSTGSGRFQATPHIGASRKPERRTRQSGYGKFGPPEGFSGLGGPRVAKPGGSRPVLTNRNAVPPPMRPRGLGVPSALTPPAKPPKVKKVDNRGVILPSDKDPAAEVSPLNRGENRQAERVKDPLTRRYMEEFYQVAGLPPLAPLAPPAPPKQHTPGPAIGF